MNKWGKSALAAMMGLSVLGGIPFQAPAAHAASVPMKLVLDDVPWDPGTAPVLRNNVTLLPFRAVGNALGIQLSWDNVKKQVSAQSEVGGALKKVVLTVGKKSALVDGQTVALLAEPIIVNGQVFIPLSFFGNQLGAGVGWEKATNTVRIVSPKRAMHLRSFYALGSFQQRDRIADLNSVVFGWSGIDENGEFTTTGTDYKWPQPSGDVTPESLVQDSAAQGAKPYLMVYSLDGNNQLTKMLSDDTLRGKALDGIETLVKDAGFGGVVLDFEGLGWKSDPKSQQTLLNDFVKLLSERLQPLGATISLAVPPPNSAYKGYDYKTLATMAEDLIVMAYDYGPNGQPEPNAKVDQAIAMTLAAGVDKSKIVLGINLANEKTDTVDDKLGLAKRYGLKGAAFWLLKIYSQPFADAIGLSTEKAGE